MSSVKNKIQEIRLSFLPILDSYRAFEYLEIQQEQVKIFIEAKSEEEIQKVERWLIR